MDTSWTRKENSVRGRGSWHMLAACVLLVGTFGTGCGAKSGSGAGDGGLTEVGSGSSLNTLGSTGLGAGGGPFTDVRFAFDSVELDSGAQAAISQNAGYLQQNAGVKAEIEGHCDERGTTEYNLALGARRAKTVRDALIARGISASRLSTVSYGEELPLCKESTESCWAHNRRAHLVDLTK